MHEELNRLPDRYRVPIVLCDLEGRTCEEAARHLGCPIGTIGSRLARGRGAVRGRLACRGLAPAVGALTAVLSTGIASWKIAAAPVEIHEPSRDGHCGRADGRRHVLAAASVKLAENILRSLLMVKLMSFGAAVAAVVGLGLVANWTLQPPRKPSLRTQKSRLHPSLTRRAD